MRRRFKRTYCEKKQKQRTYSQLQIQEAQNLTPRRFYLKDKSARFIYIPLEEAARNLACNNGKYFIPKIRQMFAIESGGWTVKAAPFIIVDGKKANIIGRNILPKTGIAFVQKTKTQSSTYRAWNRKLR